MEVLQQFYETTLVALEKAKNDRLWFKVNIYGLEVGGWRLGAGGWKLEIEG